MMLQTSLLVLCALLLITLLRLASATRPFPEHDVQVHAVSVKASPDTNTSCPLCDVKLFGNSSILDGEFLDSYLDLHMRNESGLHPKTLVGTFRGAWVCCFWTLLLLVAACASNLRSSVLRLR